MFVDGLKCGAVALSSRSDQPPDLVSFHVRAIIQMCKSRQSRKILRPRRARSNRAPTKKPQPKNLAAETLVVRKNRSAGVSPASEPRQLLLCQHDLCRLEAGDTFFSRPRSTRRGTENPDASVKSPCAPCLRGETGRLAAPGSLSESQLPDSSGKNSCVAGAQ